MLDLNILFVSSCPDLHSEERKGLVCCLLSRIVDVKVYYLFVMLFLDTSVSYDISKESIIIASFVDSMLRK